MSDREIDVFKALSHPLRRKILKLIAEKGSASYSDLVKLEPKAGVLYHHIRLLGDLIYQDENKQYRLTKKGLKAYDFMVSFFIEPQDTSIHKYITPRWFLELLEGRIVIALLIIFIATSFCWTLGSNIPVLLVFVPGFKVVWMLAFLIPILNWIGASLVLVFMVRVFLGRRVYLEEMLFKSLPAFIIINTYPLLNMALRGVVILEVCVLLLIQLFALLFLASAVSVVVRVPIRTAGLIVISLHYVSILIALGLVGYLKIG